MDCDYLNLRDSISEMVYLMGTFLLVVNSTVN